MASVPLDRRPLVEPRTVYRFVHTADHESPELRNDFLSDKARAELLGEEYVPVGREAEIPELQESMSVFGSPEPMRERWARISRRAAEKGEPVKIGDFIAEVNLEPEQGFLVEDLGAEDQHLSLWGDPDQLVGAVGSIARAAAKRG